MSNEIYGMLALSQGYHNLETKEPGAVSKAQQECSVSNYCVGTWVASWLPGT